jgi:hypothetical protein
MSDVKARKGEFEDFVRQVYATYNQTIYETERVVVMRAWWDLLQDIPIDVLRRTFLDVALTNKFMPTPGFLRRMVKDAELEDKPPSAQQAWSLLQGVVRGSVSGVHVQNDFHVVVRDTFAVLGDVALSLSTNGDREYFMGVYGEVLEKFLRDAYRVVV